MVRTQIYLTREEQRSLRSIAAATGQSQSELIRTAVDEFVGKKGGNHRLNLIRKARGIWKSHPALPDVRKMRRAWNRG